MSYLVTGAAGFIGSHLVETLLNQGKNVVGIDNFSGSAKENLAFLDTHPNKRFFRFEEGDIRDANFCKKICEGVYFILHQAALGSVPRSLELPELYHENNVTGTLNMLMAAKDAGVKRFVFAASSSVYGDTLVLPKIESMIPNPKSPYAASKVACEYYCSVFTHAFGLPTIILRYFNVFGPRQNPHSQYAAVIPKFVTAFLHGQSPVIFGSGEQTRDFTYIKNVVHANLEACRSDSVVFGQPVNIGCGYRISLNTLAKNIQQLVGSAQNPVYESPRAGDVQDSLADIGLAEAYGLLRNPVLLEEGLKETVTWYQESIV